MHPQKTKQHYIRSTSKNRTRKKKSAVEEDPQKSRKKIQKNEPFEYLTSTESLKRERPKNKPKKRTTYIKTALQIVKNGDTENRKGKEQGRAEKANK